MLDHTQHALPRSAQLPIAPTSPWTDAMQSELERDGRPVLVPRLRRNAPPVLNEAERRRAANPWLDGIQSDLAD